MAVLHPETQHALATRATWVAEIDGDRMIIWVFSVQIAELLALLATD
jgi:hypothetical protein